MITFDKLKIITNINYITNIDFERFVTHLKGDELLYYKYKQTSPFLLEVRADYNKHELVIEFTSKILREQYKELINKNNITRCFDEINRLGICQLNTQQILSNSLVAKCDITKDIKGYDIKDIINQIRQNLSNYQKWVCKNYAGGLVLENAVSTPRHKKRLTIYDKEKELMKATNAEFLKSLPNMEETIKHFTNTVRFELNINTEKQIRELLKISNNDLNNVIHSNANPILTIMDEAIREVKASSTAQNLRDYEHELFLKECHYDLSEVEAKIRGLISKNTSISRIMQPYKILHQQYFNFTSKNVTQLRNLIT